MVIEGIRPQQVTARQRRERGVGLPRRTGQAASNALSVTDRTLPTVQQDRGTLGGPLMDGSPLQDVPRNKKKKSTSFRGTYLSH